MAGRDLWLKLKGPFGAGGRALLAALLVYGFFIVVMTASAQQRVIAFVEKQNLDVAYSEARRHVAGAHRVEQEIAAKTERRELLLREARTAEREAHVLSAGVLAARLSEVDGIVQALSARGIACAGWDSQDVIVRIEALKNCELPAAADRWTRSIQSLVLAEPRIEHLVAEMNGHDREAVDKNDRAEALGVEIAALQERLRTTEVLRRAFADLTPVDSVWFGAGVLAELPPFMLQFVLAFFSGAFGALLIALILLVYPNSTLRDQRGEGYLTRLALGGLIAVGVYVVMSSGASVLGDASVENSGANTMTLAAVGILAGAFSDRVAQWLSKRAEIFSATDDAAPPAAADPSAPPEQGEAESSETPRAA